MGNWQFHDGDLLFDRQPASLRWTQTTCFRIWSTNASLGRSGQADSRRRQQPRDLGCLDRHQIKRVCKSLEDLKKPPTMAKKMHSFATCNRWFDLPSWREPSFPLLFFCFSFKFCKSAWNVRTARVYVRRVVMRVLPPWPQPARRSKCRTKNLTCHDPGGACSLKRRMFETYVPAVWTNEEFQLALQILSLLLCEDLGMKRSPYEKNSVPFSMAADRSQIDHLSIWRAMRWSLQFEINFLVVTGKKIVWNSSMFLHF